MKVKQGVDLGKAFDKLKETLIETENVAHGEDKYRYPFAYGRLASAVQCFLFFNSDAKSMDEILTPENNLLTSKPHQ